MLQQAKQSFMSDCQEAEIIVKNSMPIGKFHDFLMEVKGLMVERMVQAQKEQEEEAKKAMELPPHESEAPIPPLPEAPKAEEPLQAV